MLLSSKQCDQIGLFVKDLGCKICYKRSPYICSRRCYNCPSYLNSIKIMIVCHFPLVSSKRFPVFAVTVTKSSAYQELTSCRATAARTTNRKGLRSSSLASCLSSWSSVSPSMPSIDSGKMPKQELMS